MSVLLRERERKKYMENKQKSVATLATALGNF